MAARENILHAVSCGLANAEFPTKFAGAPSSRDASAAVPHLEALPAQPRGFLGRAVATIDDPKATASSAEPARRSSDAPEPNVPKPLPVTKEHRRRREHRRNRRTVSLG